MSYKIDYVGKGIVCAPIRLTSLILMWLDKMGVEHVCSAGSTVSSIFVSMTCRVVVYGGFRVGGAAHLGNREKAPVVLERVVVIKCEAVVSGVSGWSYYTWLDPADPLFFKRLGLALRVEVV